MLLSVLAVCTEEELGPEGTPSEVGSDADESAARREQIRAKILTIGRMQRVFNVLREETENAAELQAQALARHDAGPQTLGVNGNHIRQYIRNFDDAYDFPSFFPVPMMLICVP